MDEISREMKSWYIENLATRIEALEGAGEAFLKGDAAAAESIRRLSHALKGSGTMYGFPEITAKAAETEEADISHINNSLQELLGLLRSITEANEAGAENILLIEDDEAFARILASRFDSQRLKIISAASGREALKTVDNFAISLIILDLILPDMDGRNLLIELKSMPGKAGIPVIVLTGKTGLQTRTECLALGADAFFEKPVDPAVIFSTAASLMENSKQESFKADRDTLTGIPNRGVFNSEYGHHIPLAARKGYPVSIAVIDLDRFKSVNDTYGHNTGDAVLKKTASLIKSSVRNSDIFARWGGEEFVLLMPDTNLSAAAALLNQVLDKVRKEIFTSEKAESFHVSFSAGVYEIRGNLPLNEAFSAADSRLYTAKAAGRNRVQAGEEPEAPVKKKILIAEDDDLIAKVVRQRFEKEDFNVLHAADGEAALKLILSESPCLLLLDVQMPKMNGLELLKLLRKERSTAVIPVIMLTSLGGENDIVSAFSLGADDYVVKPFSPLELLARARRLIRK